MAEHRLRRLLHPASIAMIGGTRAALAIEQCDRLGYSGAIWPVNPLRAALAGRPAVASIGDLPAVPDAALVAVDRDRTVEVVAALRAIGCGGVVCYASGFAETGEDLRQRTLIAAAGRMPLMGPNCHGFVNALSGAALWPDVQGCRPVARGVAIVTQSGNLALNITMQQRGLPLAHVITLGNQAGVHIEDCLEALVDDPRVTAIGLHVEALADPLRFARSAIRAWERGTPIVVLKTGASAEGAAITRTHTASLAGSDVAYRALFERYRVAVVDTVPELLAALAVAGTYGWLPGNRVVSLSCSGGEAALVADRAVGRRLLLPAFPPDVARHVDDALGQRVPIANPLDYHTFIWGDRPALERCFVAALSAPVDVALLVVDFPAAGNDDSLWWPTVEAFVAAHRVTGRAAVVTATLPENLPLSVCLTLAEHGIPALHGIDEALAALAATAGRGARPVLHVAPPPQRGSPRRMADRVARGRLAAAGIRLPLGRICARADVVDAAEEIGYPVVVKTLGLDHKTEAGGVVVGVSDRAGLDAAVAALPDVGSGVLVEAYVAGSVAELVVGIRREYPIGWTLTIGAGGVFVELLDDTVTMLGPATRADVVEALDRLRVGHILAGHRGGSAGDVQAVADTVCRLVDLAITDPAIVELEVNPLLVLVPGGGAHAVDALILEAA